MINLLIFDLDGTLADTSRDITDAINYALKPFGVKPLTVSQTKAMVGSGITKLIGDLLAENQKDALCGRPVQSDAEGMTGEALDLFFEYYSEHLLDKTILYPGVKETLLKLEDFKKVIVSNKRESLSRKVLEGLGISEFFDLILGSDSVSEKKPSPVPILETLERLNLSKEEAVIIGDSNFDIDSGKKAGIKTIAVTYGYRSREVLKEADHMIDSFGELLTILI